MQDSLGRASGFTLGDNYSVSYGFAGDGRFSGLTSMVNGLVSNSWQYSYLQNSDLIAGVSNTVAGVSSMRAYEPSRDLITSIANRHRTTLISGFQYENDALGRRTQRIDSTTVSNFFAYNPRSELTGAIMSTNTFSYVYDNIGNRNQSSQDSKNTFYSANELNQYTNIISGSSTNQPTFDADGNMTLAPLSSFGGPLLASTLGWSGENRMVSASNSAMTASYSYDYQGRRFEKTVVTNSVTNTTTFVYDGWLLVQEQSAIAGGDGGNLTNVTQYIWGLDLSGSMQGAGGIGGLLAVIQVSSLSPQPSVYFPSTDANGNITDYVDTNGVVVAHREFDPFGNTIVATGDKVNDFHFWFSSKYLDAETGLYYYGYRYLTPELGRFVNRDPIGEIGGVNLNGFTKNDPVNRIDPLGKQCWNHGSPRVVDSFSIPLGNASHVTYWIVDWKLVSVGTPGVIVLPPGGIIVEGKYCLCKCYSEKRTYSFSIDCKRSVQPKRCEVEGLCGTISWTYDEDLGWSGGVSETLVDKKPGGTVNVPAKPYGGGFVPLTCHTPCALACSALSQPNPVVIGAPSCAALAAQRGP